MITCQRCHHLNPEGSSSCELCGTTLEGAEVVHEVRISGSRPAVSDSSSGTGAARSSPNTGSTQQVPRGTGGHAATGPAKSGSVAMLSESLLEALDDDEEDFQGHARGEDAVQPGYVLKEIPVPGRGAGHVPQAAPSGENRGAVSAAAESDAPGPSAADENVCSSCGAENQPEAKFCSECGHNLRTGEASAAYRIPAAIPASLVSINEDGSDGLAIQLEFKETTIGRAGDVRFPTDAFLSPKHARLSIEDNSVFVEDLYSLNGTYLKLQQEVKLSPGDTFLMGRQVVRFERFEHKIDAKARSNDGTRYMGSPPPGSGFKLVQIGIGGVVQSIFCLHDEGAVIGREKGDFIFPRDKFMSSRHAQIFKRDDGNFYLVDLNSSNGSWVKIWERREMVSGDYIFLGQQLFRLEIE